MRVRVIRYDQIFLQVLHRKDDWKKNVSSRMSITRVCVESDFLSVQVIESQLYLRICKIFSSNLSKILQKKLEIEEFIFPFFSSSDIMKIEASSKKSHQVSHRGRKNQEKVHSLFAKGYFSKLEESSKIQKFCRFILASRTFIKANNSVVCT